MTDCDPLEGECLVWKSTGKHLASHFHRRSDRKAMCHFAANETSWTAPATVHLVQMPFRCENVDVLIMGAVRQPPSTDKRHDFAACSGQGIPCKPHSGVFEEPDNDGQSVSGKTLGWDFSSTEYKRRCLRQQWLEQLFLRANRATLRTASPSWFMLGQLDQIGVA
jgi:hypothetical protein